MLTPKTTSAARGLDIFTKRRQMRRGQPQLQRAIGDKRNSNNCPVPGHKQLHADRSIQWTAVVDCVEAQLSIAGGDLLGPGESPEQAVIRLAGDTVNLLRL